jgi:protein-export membrane protein SecD
MSRKYYIFIGVVILAILAGVFAYPNWYDNGVNAANHQFGWHLPQFPEKGYSLGLDLQGGVSLLYQADLSTVSDKGAAMSSLQDVIERRVNLFGVSEPTVAVQGTNQLLVELPGVTDVSQAISMIGETPYLEFDQERTTDDTNKILAAQKDVLAAQTAGKDYTKLADYQTALENPYFEPTQLTGQYLSKAAVIYDPTTYQPEVQLTFNTQGAQLFAQVTGDNVGKPLAIYLDGASIIDTNGDGKIDGSDLYAPTVQAKITAGSAVISGNMSSQTASTLVSRLNAGALPVKIGTPISQETVGPTLGSDSLEKSLVAGMYGLLAVALFMIVIYRLPGLLAVIALLIYVMVNLALFKLIPVTLTLAGIGGFILSIGMAVDANILIFARMREEVKTGKSIPAAIDEGFKRAWPSIRDSNFNSLIVCAILFFFSTSFIKGFAFTLALGIVLSLFSALFITRIFLQIFIGNWAEKKKWLL